MADLIVTPCPRCNGACVLYTPIQTGRGSLRVVECPVCLGSGLDLAKRDDVCAGTGDEGGACEEEPT